MDAGVDDQPDGAHQLQFEPSDVPIRVVFVELSKYIDPDTKQVWYNFWSPRVVEKVKSSDSVQAAESLVKKSGGQVQEKKFPTRYKGLLEEETYISEFLNHALLWETEEFEFSLLNGWVESEKLIPAELASTFNTVIRNAKDFLLKKQVEDRAIICLRNKDNEIKAEKIVSLVEV